MKGFPKKFEAICSQYSLVCEYLQANIRLNVKFAYSFANIRFSANILKQKNIRQYEQILSKYSLCSKYSLQHVFFCIKSNICMRIRAIVLTENYLAKKIP